MSKRTREKTVLDAFVKFLQEQDGEKLVLAQTADEPPPRAGGERKSPNFLFTGKSGCVAVELTELVPPTPHQLRRTRVRRIHKTLASVAWPAGSYAVEVLTHDDRKVKQLIGSEEFKRLMETAYRLEPTSTFGSDVNAYAEAFYRRDPRYFAADPGGIMLLSKQSAAGSGIIINGPHDSAQADGTVTLSDRQGHLLELATTSGGVFEPDVLESSLEELFVESEEKLDSRSDCRGILLLDVAGYPAAPPVIESAVVHSHLGRWPRISEVMLFVDEPYSVPPPPSGVVSDHFRFWRVKAS
jgi:hypothetical protein